MQRSLATVSLAWHGAGWGCSGAPRRARLISHSALAAALRVTAHIGQVLYFVFGPVIKCHSRSTGPLACAGRLRSKLSESLAEPGSQGQHELRPALRVSSSLIGGAKRGPHWELP
jgi:hypothetical protein